MLWHTRKRYQALQRKHVQSTVQLTFSCYMPHLPWVVVALIEEHLWGLAVLRALCSAGHITQISHDNV